MSLVSIIVPVYNVRDYLEDCLDSILESTLRDIEVIVVDDGSTDGSGEICDRYKQKDSRLRVFHKKNEGLSETRNFGFKYATGQFVSFVDGDDFVHPQLFEFLYLSLVDHSQASLSMCIGRPTFSKKSETDLSKKNVMEADKTIICKDELIKNLVCRGTYDRTQIVVVWNKLYRYDSIKNLKFKESGCEDFQFNCELFFTVECVVFINMTLYYWVQRSTSITHQALSPKMIDQVTVYDYCYDMVSKQHPKYASFFLDKLIKNYLSVRLRRSTSDYPDYAQEVFESLRQKCLAELRRSNLSFFQKRTFEGLIEFPMLYKALIQLSQAYSLFMLKLK